MAERWKGEKVDSESCPAFVVVVASLDGRLGSIHGRSDGHSRQERLDSLQIAMHRAALVLVSSADLSGSRGQVYTAVRAGRILRMNNFLL